ncbi:AN1-type zinc finger protein 1-like [Phymastichus coffea]|uniref:AN1-type zinc finger protein 1-like n=1 Tax=Phymastichus coffea TaxID=108790 RepID=UPI00273B7CEE|nr:AN1-type zinc finger protein 1-like [Phymastichus coffea]
MEFPKTGQQCTIDDCKQLDFLPFTCNYCGDIFCKNHFHVTCHKCCKVIDNEADGTEKLTHFVCTKDECSEKSPVEMPCVKCKKHFCLIHRHHGCLELSTEQKLSELKKWEKPKQEFVNAKTVADKEIAKNLKKSQNSAMANKVRLMRLKSKSCGNNGIPADERCYFLVYYPINGSTKSSESSKGVFVSTYWSIGKVIDTIADLLKVPNNNNNTNAIKLRLFDYSTGNIVEDQMDTNLGKVIEAKTLFNGQDVILEYSNEKIIDCNLY